MPSSPRAVFLAPAHPLLAPLQTNAGLGGGGGGGGAGPLCTPPPPAPQAAGVPARPHVRLMFRLSLATHWSRGLPLRRSPLRIANNNTNSGGPCAGPAARTARHRRDLWREPRCKGSFMRPHKAATERRRGQHRPCSCLHAHHRPHRTCSLSSFISLSFLFYFILVCYEREGEVISTTFLLP